MRQIRSDLWETRVDSPFPGLTTHAYLWTGGPDGNVWGQTKWWLLLAVVIIVLAPLGDLTESMFKRNLEIKDFGTIVQGHGGVLDRFDGFLFVLPGAYYLTLVLLANP